MRRFEKPPLKGQTYIRRPGVYAILPLNDQLLITHQSKPEPEFQLPGGGIDRNESALTALHREVLEETGWTIGQIRKLGVYKKFVFMPEYDLWAEKICHIYLARPVKQKHDPLEQYHTACFMKTLDALDCLVNEGDRAFVERFCL